MTANPYAPPSADLDAGGPSGSCEGTGAFDIGVCLSEAWAGTWANFPLRLFAFLTIGVLSLLSIVTVAGLILALPHLMFGSAYFFLRLHETSLSSALGAPIHDLSDALRTASARLYLEQRRDALRTLERSGALLLDTEPKKLPVALVNRYLEVKASGVL